MLMMATAHALRPSGSCDVTLGSCPILTAPAISRTPVTTLGNAGAEGVTERMTTMAYAMHFIHRTDR
jgi:hypothetical protein